MRNLAGCLFDTNLLLMIADSITNSAHILQKPFAADCIQASAIQLDNLQTNMIQNNSIENNIIQTHIEPIAAVQPDIPRTTNVQIENNFELIASAIQTSGFIILPGAIQGKLYRSLLRLKQIIPAHEFHAAGIGQGEQQNINQQIRGDEIYWLNDNHIHSRRWFIWCESLRVYLSRRLLLGLTRFESQLAFYSAGAFYKKHRDSFRGNNNRLLTVVTYLNEDWQADDGGELVLYPKTQPPIYVPPQSGTIAIFLSEEMLHEVRPTYQSRYSVTCWFRTDSAVL
ncbi:2OG-Fe(II) oxygenase [Aliikangiella maris]|uniref:2OG-Fe(II) oxygenase n=2 Tax=Aliikangiella maris TaxID=3162458 RepID=A0ABV2BQE9_9GAMM